MRHPALLGGYAAIVTHKMIHEKHSGAGTGMTTHNNAYMPYLVYMADYFLITQLPE